MTSDEKLADKGLLRAKDYVKEAFRILDPAAKEPLAKAILKAIDSIDAARKALKERMPE
jgi:hypothetical protein